MTQGAQSSGVFIATDITSIAINTTVVNGTDFTALPLQVWDLDTIIISTYCTGAVAACALTVLFEFVGTVDGTNWDTAIYYDQEITLVGVTPVQMSEAVNVIGFHSFRLQQITNNETVAGRTVSTVNARFGKSYWGKRW